LPSGLVKASVRRTTSTTAAWPPTRIVPGRAERVLEVGHKDARPAVEGVDHHLGFGRPGDLDPAVVQVGRDRHDPPVARPDLGRLGREIRQLARGEPALTLVAGLEQRRALGAEAPLQIGQKGQRLRREDPGPIGRERCKHLDTVGRAEGRSHRSPQIRANGEI
jgi:hypothetical protein